MGGKMLTSRQRASCCSTAQPACRSSARPHVNRDSIDSLPGGYCWTKLNNCASVEWRRSGPAWRRFDGRSGRGVAGPKKGCSLTSPVTLTRRPPGAQPGIPGGFERRFENADGSGGHGPEGQDFCVSINEPAICSSERADSALVSIQSGLINGVAETRVVGRALRARPGVWP